MSDHHQWATDLIAAADQGTCDGVVKLLLDAPETDRTELRKIVITDLRQRLNTSLSALKVDVRIDATEEDETEPAGDEEPSVDPIAEYFEAVKRERLRTRALQLAIIGIGVRKEVEAALFAVRPHAFLEEDPGFWILALKLLATRKTDWQGTVIIRALEGKANRWEDYRVIQARLKRGMAIVRDGVIPEEVLIPHLCRLARQSGTFDFRSELGRKVVWAALEARDEPFIGNSIYDPAMVIEKLGRVDRPRLIALGLERLGQQSRGQAVNWWAQLVEGLKIASQEWAVHRESALDLVNAPTPRAVGIGVAAVKTLLKEGVIAPSELVPVLAAAVQVETQGTARNVIQLLRASARQDTGLREEALLAALGGLMHPKNGVADAVLDWLEEEIDWREEPAVSLALADLLETLTGPPAVRLARLLPCSDTQAPQPGDAGTGPATEPAERLRAHLDSLIAAERLPEQRDWLERCRRALEGKAPVPETREDPRLLWRRDPQIIYPSNSEETARLILTITANRRLDSLGQTRLLAGLAQPVPEAERSHIRRLLDPAWNDSFFGRYARIWLGEMTEEDAEAVQALGIRLDRLPIPLPTHSSGWLDPATFVERMINCPRLQVEEFPEVAAALYRLPNDLAARAAAWARLPPMLDKFGPDLAAALRLALEPDEPALRTWDERLTACGADWRRVLLVAAARRCRMPEEDGEWLSRVAASLPSYRERMTLQDFAVLPSGYGSPLAFGSFNWPAGVQMLLEQVLSRGSNQWADTLVDALRSALRSDIRVRHLAPQILDMVAHENTRVRGAAVDLIVCGLGDGRIYAQDLLEHLAPRLRLSASRPRVLLTLLNRLAENGEPLRAIAACCLETGLAGGVDGISGAERTALFEALLGWHSTAGRTVEDPCARAILEALAAERKKNRSVEVAQQLVQLPVSSPQPPLPLVCLVFDVTKALERMVLASAG